MVSADLQILTFLLFLSRNNLRKKKLRWKAFASDLATLFERTGTYFGTFLPRAPSASVFSRPVMLREGVCLIMCFGFNLDDSRHLPHITCSKFRLLIRSWHGLSELVVAWRFSSNQEDDWVLLIWGMTSKTYYPGPYQCESTLTEGQAPWQWLFRVLNEYPSRIIQCTYKFDLLCQPEMMADTCDKIIGATEPFPLALQN